MIQTINREYFDQTYIPNQEFIVQKGVKSSRPETEVRLHSADRSRVNYSDVPQGVLNRPYEEKSYQDMKYHFKGYPGTNLVWFDSEIGGQGTSDQEDIEIYPYKFDQGRGKIGGVGDTWSDVRDASEGSSGESVGLYYSYVRSGRAAPLGSEFFITRFFLGFDLSSVGNKNITGVTFRLTFLFPYLATRTSISIQPSNHNPTRDYEKGSGGNELYSQFYSVPFAFSVNTGGTTDIKFNSVGVGFVKRKIGSWVSFCIREYTYDYLNVEPGSDTNYSNYFYTANSSIAYNRPTLILHY